MAWFLIFILVVVVSLSIPRSYGLITKPKKQRGVRRDDAEKWLRDEGYLPKTHQEALIDAEQERIAQIRFSDPPDGTYYDRNWHLRDIHTDRLL